MAPPYNVTRHPRTVHVFLSYWPEDGKIRPMCCFISRPVLFIRSSLSHTKSHKFSPYASYFAIIHMMLCTCRQLRSANLVSQAYPALELHSSLFSNSTFFFPGALSTLSASNFPVAISSSMLAQHCLLRAFSSNPILSPSLQRPSISNFCPLRSTTFQNPNNPGTKPFYYIQKHAANPVHVYLRVCRPCAIIRTPLSSRSMLTLEGLNLPSPLSLYTPLLAL